MAREKKIPWFRVYIQTSGTLEGISDEALGRAFKLALRYFDSAGTDTSVVQEAAADTETRIAFLTIKRGIDDSIREYRERQEDGRRGAEEKKKLQKQYEQVIQQLGGKEKMPWD